MLTPQPPRAATRPAHPRSRRPAALLLAVLAAVGPAGSNTVLAADAGEIVVIASALDPAHLEVAPGTSVTWRNDDSERHRMRSTEGAPEAFDSGNLEPGESYTFTFSIAGAYPYLDERDDENPAYAGMVVVVDGGAGSSGDGSAGTSLPLDGGVIIADRLFQPPSIEIATGGTVTWTNQDGEGHTVTSTDGAFESGILGGGATFSQAFAEPGTYPYLCAIHTEMRGTVVVSDVSAVASGAPPAAASVSAMPSAAPSTSPSASASASPSTSQSASASASASPSAAASASASAEPSTSAPGSGSSAPIVFMAGSEFSPASLDVRVGETVAWVNDDALVHTVTAVDGSFNSGVLQPSAAFSQVFDTPGTYDYLCAVHPLMRGTVTVSE